LCKKSLVINKFCLYIVHIIIAYILDNIESTHTLMVSHYNVRKRKWQQEKSQKKREGENLCIIHVLQLVLLNSSLEALLLFNVTTTYHKTWRCHVFLSNYSLFPSPLTKKTPPQEGPFALKKFDYFIHSLQI